MGNAVVVGGGISGIAAATYLVQRGFKTCLLEASPVLGGRVGTRRTNHGEVDLGGRNFTLHDTNLLELFGAYGVHDLCDYQFNSRAVGQTRSVDLRSTGTVATRLTRLVRNIAAVGPRSLSRVYQLARRARRIPGGGLVGSPFWAELAETTGDPTAAHYFGDALAEGLLRPWTLRMMGSEPDEIYLCNLGPLLGKAPAGLKRIEGGMGVFLRAVAGKLPVKAGHRVASVIQEGDRVAGVEGTDAEGRPFRLAADVVVVATTALEAADMLPSAPLLAAVLRENRYQPVATVVAEYDAIQFPDGLGGLFLPKECAVSHIAKYDGECRVRFSFAGVAARKLIDLGSIGLFLEVGERVFREYGGTLGRGVSSTGEIWRPGLCAQTKFHHRTLQSIREHSDQVIGLVLAGDYFRGNLLSLCVTSAKENVERALGRLSAS
jgi:protoporphyrinogen/coproporphyrinogen III oxidase